MTDPLSRLRAMSHPEWKSPLEELRSLGSIGAWEATESPNLQRRRLPDGTYEYRANPAGFEGAPGVEHRGGNDRETILTEAIRRERKLPKSGSEEVLDQLAPRVAANIASLPEAPSMAAGLLDRAMRRPAPPAGLSASELMNPRTLYSGPANEAIDKVHEKRADAQDRLAEDMTNDGFSPVTSALADAGLEVAAMQLDPTNVLPVLGGFHGARGARSTRALADMPDAMLSPEMPIARQLPEDRALASFPNAHPMLELEARTARNSLLDKPNILEQFDAQTGYDHTRGVVQEPRRAFGAAPIPDFELPTEARFSAFARSKGFDPYDLSSSEEHALRQEWHATEIARPIEEDARPDIVFDPKARAIRVGDAEFDQVWKAKAYRDSLDPVTGQPPPTLTRERWEQLRAGLSDQTAGRIKAAKEAPDRPVAPLDAPAQPRIGVQVAEAYSGQRAGIEAQIKAGVDQGLITPEQVNDLRAQNLRALDADWHGRLSAAARQSDDPTLAMLADETEEAVIQPLEAPPLRPYSAPQLRPIGDIRSVTKATPPHYRSPTPHPSDAVIRYGPDPKLPVRQRIRNAADDFIDRYSNKEEAGPRLLRRAGLVNEARELELYIGKKRGAARIAANVVKKGVQLWDPVTQSSKRIYDSFESIVGGLDGQAYRDLNDLMAAQHHMELVARRDLAAQDFAAKKALWKPGDALIEAHPDARLDIHQDGTTISQGILSDIQQRYGIDPVTSEVNQLGHIANRIREWSNAAIIEQLDSVGFFSPDRKSAVLAKNKEYAPFLRLLDEVADDPNILAGGSTSNPIKKISGGLSPDRPIAPPLESFVAHAQRIAMWVEKQRVKNLLGDFAEAHPVEVGNEIKKVNAAQANNAFQVFRDGQRHLYSAPADVLKAVDNLTPPQANIFMQAGVVAARMLRAGATLTPDFALRNFLRDQATAGVYGAEFHFRPFLDFFPGLFAQTPLGGQLRQFVERWESAGGALSDYINLERPQVQLQAHAAAGLVKLPGGRLVRAPRLAHLAADWAAEKNVFAKIMYPILRPMEGFSGAIEQATRIGAFRRATLGGATDLEAANFSRNITLDFGRVGSAVQRWNSVEAFANANLQDVARFSKAMRERPIGTMLSAGAFVTVPALAVYWGHKDDPAYTSLPEYERANFLHVEKVDKWGRWFRIPRPQGVMNLLFGYGITKALRAANDELGPHPVNELLSTIFSETPLRYSPVQPDPQGGAQGSLEFLPTAMQPIAEVAAGEAGWSSYRQGPMVPRGLEEGAVPEERYLDSTSATARWLGQKTGTAPLKIDYLIRGYGAGLTTTLMRGIEKATGAGTSDLPELPSSAKDLPAVGGLISASPYGFASQPVQDLYALEKQAAAAKANLETAAEQGRVKDYQRILREHPEALFAEELTDAKKELGDLRKERREIRVAPGLQMEGRADMLLQRDMAATQIAAARMHWVTDMLRGLDRKQRKEKPTDPLDRLRALPGEEKRQRTGQANPDRPRTSDDVDRLDAQPWRSTTLADITRTRIRGERRYKHIQPGGAPETERQKKNRREIGETAKIWQQKLKERGIEQPNGELFGLGEYFLGEEIKRRGVNQNPDSPLERLGASGRRAIKEKGPGLGRALAGDKIALAKIQRTLLDSFTTESTDRMTEILAKARGLYAEGIRGRALWDRLGPMLDDKNAFGE